MTPTTFEARQRHQAFTLIELLVVISIIALLISLLLPSLAQARKAAVNAQCKSRMRQVGIAIFSYRADNKAYFPVYQMQSTSGGVAYPGWGDQQYLFINQVAPYLNLTKSKKQLGIESSPRNNFLQCPANGWEGYKDSDSGGYPYIRKFVNVNGSTMTWTYDPPCQLGFAFWKQWQHYAGANYRPKQRDPAIPSIQMLASENTGRVGYVSTGLNAIRYYHPNHSSNILLTDGHVSSFQEGKFAESGFIYKWPQP